MGVHSEWGASGFERIMLCPGSKTLCEKESVPESNSVYAAEGTAAHQLLTWVLQGDNSASDYIGVEIHIDHGGRVCPSADTSEFSFVVDAKMAGHVQTLLDYVQDIKGADGIVLVDKRVCYGSYLGLGHEDAYGTLDVAVLRVEARELVVVDFKYGMGVSIHAGEGSRPNPQLALYGLGMLKEVQEDAQIDRVRLVISQPRITAKPSEFDMSSAELERWGSVEGAHAVAQAFEAKETYAHGDRDGWASNWLNPGDKQCKFCKVKASCPAFRSEVLETVGIDAATPDELTGLKVPGPEHITPTPMEWLEAVALKTDLIESWCKAVRAEVQRRLFAGVPSSVFKLVQGKQGNRARTDAAAAEELLRKGFRLPVEKAYDMTLISPTSAEKLMKSGTIGPRQWPKAEALITRPPGKPHVALISDARPALVIGAAVDDFQTVTEDDFS